MQPFSDKGHPRSLQGGGSFMDNVNEAQKLVDLPDENGRRRKSATLP